jgi:hypothetical protein
MSTTGRDGDWGELRCGDCVAAARRRGVLPHGVILCAYLMGGLMTSGAIRVKCRACKRIQAVDARNQYGDGYYTFRVGTYAPTVVSVDVSPAH